MNEAGVSVIPVFHYGEDWGVLKEYCGTFPHVGLSCRFGESVKDSIRWVEQCFARSWPHCFHSFGWISEQILDRVPFDTADASTWVLAPSAFGRWQSFGGAKLSISSTNPELRYTTEIEHYLDIQLRLEERWKKELTPLRLSSLCSNLASRRMLSTWSPGKGTTL